MFLQLLNHSIYSTELIRILSLSSVLLSFISPYRSSQLLLTARLQILVQIPIHPFEGRLEAGTFPFSEWSKGIGYGTVVCSGSQAVL